MVDAYRRSMRVAVVSESFLPTTNGVTNSVRKVLEYLRDNGHEAIVIVPAAGAPQHYAGFRVHEVPAVAYRQFPVGLPSPAVETLIARFRPDVIHAASPFLLGAQAIAAGRRLGIPSVAIFQTDVAGYARRNRLGAATRFAWRIVRWIHDGASLTLVPSSASMNDLHAAGVGRLVRWGRGVDLDLYHPRNRADAATAELRASLAPNGETIVGYVGRLAPEKQVERIRSLRGLPQESPRRSSLPLPRSSRMTSGGPRFRRFAPGRAGILLIGLACLVGIGGGGALGCAGDGTTRTSRQLASMTTRQDHECKDGIYALTGRG